MTDSLHRREFLGVATSASVALAAGSALAKPMGANDRIAVGVMGTGGRGTALARAFHQLPNVEVVAVCDVDAERANRAATAVQQAGQQQGRAPRVVGDFRRLLDDRDLHVMVCATCNHWHAPATILACAAGKHVYVEKPCSYNPREGELMVQAATRHNRKVQMGNQRRSWPKVIEAIEQVRSGAIGRAYFAQCWYHANRTSIGRGREAAVPQGLDYALWQGPAPARPFRTNYLHYNWHWFWHWGNGELGNNGVHFIDLCRWGLDVNYPTRVTSAGGRYHFEDDQETPDTHHVNFEFEGRKMITWEGLSCNRMPTGRVADVIFYGDNGSLAITGGEYVIRDRQGMARPAVSGISSDTPHFANFLDGVRSGARLNSDIDGAYKSTLLCHLGNIAQRTGRSLRCDPANGHIQNDAAAMQMWSREYAQGWEPRV